MFTIFHLLAVAAVVTLTICGANLGSRFGVVGGWVGGIAFLVLALTVVRFAWLAFTLVFLPGVFRLRSRTPEELRVAIRSDTMPPPNFALMELSARNLLSADDLRTVVDLLLSDRTRQRQLAWAAFNTVFPELRSMVPDYRPGGRADARLAALQPILRNVDAAFGRTQHGPSTLPN
ncbi:MAG: hypothetical protein JNK53_06995 [Phycisphaerae bacterium]|nr:hypothetical protein [Phycisphaerae bacterium]